MISSRAVLAVAIAARPVRQRRVAGSSGKPNGGIDPARKGGFDAGSNRVAGERGSVRNRQPPPTLRSSRRARVITQAMVGVWAEKFRVIDQVVMKGSIARVVLLGNVSVRPYVKRRYVLLVCEIDVGKMSARDVRCTPGEPCLTRVRAP